MKSILITGGSGSFGTAMTKHLLTYGAYDRIVIFSRGEHRQAEMEKALGPDTRLRFFIGDIRDRDRLRRALHDIDDVIHAAALKRIEVGFYNPIEMVKTNVIGAMNLIEASQDAGVRRVVLLSSDKAFQPISPYGASKALAESIFLSANNITGWNGPKFFVCRYGNIWGSQGSVVPTWINMLANGADELPVTDPECTRFFMRIEESVGLVLNTMNAEIGKIAIPVLPAYRLGDLAEAMNARIGITGLPSWEKLHESMDFGNSSDTARRMSVDELRAELAREVQ